MKFNYTVTLNEDKNGIEISFSSKPDGAILEKLRDNGFRWSFKQKIWYAKQTTERMDFIKSFSDCNLNMEKTAVSADSNKGKFDLWDATRTDAIEDNYSKYRLYDCKEIAAIIRKHLRERFPMCKWSVTSDRRSITVILKESPFDKNSDELKAIINYADKFMNSYNYDNSDPYIDYFDVNFCDICGIDYDYKHREATVSEHNMTNEFAAKKEAFEQSERERKEREFQEYVKKREAEEIEDKKLEAELKARHEIIENSAEFKDVSYYVIGCYTTNRSKENTVDGYTDDHDGEFEVKYRREDCKVSREVYFTPEVYELFSHQLLDNYTFLAGMGGSATDDERINSMEDYNKMSREERETVKWYMDNCVAVFCGSKLKLVIDPQGYGYARYVYFVDNLSRVSDKNGAA